MKKYFWIIILIIVIIASIYIFNKNKKENTEKDSYTAERTSITTEDININENKQQYKEEQEDKEQLSEYSTKLPKDTKARYSNIDLACNTLNGTIVKKGETFSLWNVLGCPTKEEGYRKAKAFTSEGKIRYSYGGGICQVSTTIYNAVLEVKELDIKERHEHSRDVVYIEDGKDAAVSYKSADFKFKNSLDYDIQIEAKLEDNKVKIKLIRI